MPAPQSYKNHGRTDSPMHFFVFPVLMLNLAFAIYAAIHHGTADLHLHLWWIIVSVALLVLAFKTRINDLKLQDRIIRLEERLRITSLVPTAEVAHINELEIKQLVALRFASDAELPALVHRTLTQNLEPKAIKQSITNWRADNHRV